MKYEAKKIVERLASAIAATSSYGPAEMREAIAHVISPRFSGDPEEREVITAFVNLLDARAGRKERLLHKAFGSKKET